MVSKYMKLGPYVNYFNERICVHIKELTALMWSSIIIY